VPIAELTRNAVDVLPVGELENKLALGRPLRVKFGIDVTSPDIHVGRGIPLQRLRSFQDEGHAAVLIIGDYTTRIGDPSGRSNERPILSDDEIDANARLYLEQAKVILRDDEELLEVRYNGEWLSKLSYADVVRLGRIVTVARMLERDDFEKRYRAGEPISISELLYPLMQAYDSVAIEADVELGGTDQLYNLLAGREVMEAYGLSPQVVLTTPLLLSWDGEKMSSSVGNNIPLTAPPEEMFGRTMRIPDSQLEEWWTLVAERPVPEGDPMKAKLELARLIVERSHGEEAAREAEAHFDRVVRNRELPEEVPVACGRSGPSAGTSRRRLQPFDQRGAAADLTGRGQARRRLRERARPASGPPRRGRASGRQEALRSAQRSRLTHARTLLHFPGCPRGRRGKVPASDQNGEPQEDSPQEEVQQVPRPLARVEAFFVPSARVRSLKTQQRAFTSRRRSGLPERRINNLSGPLCEDRL
jgi:tyrosyl-tRNA synthetase